MEYRLEYRQEPEDLVRFLLYHVTNSESVRKRSVAQQVILPVLYILVAMYLHHRGQPVGVAIMVACAIGWFCYWPTWARNRYRRHFEKHVAEMGEKPFRDPLVVTLGEDGVHVSSGAGEKTYRYEDISEIGEEEGYTHVCFGQCEGLVVPHDRAPADLLDGFLRELVRRCEAASRAEEAGEKETGFWEKGKGGKGENGSR